MNDLIVNLSPTGMIPTKEMNPDVPISPAEIAADVLGCAQHGITIAHLHARDEQGKPTWKKEVYAEIIGRIRAVRTDLVLCVSLSGRDWSELEKRSDVLSLEGDLKPDIASLTLSSLNFSTQASVNSPDMVKALAQEMARRGIVPELEVFDLGMANYAKYMITKGLIDPICTVNVFLGGIAGAQLDLVHAGAILHSLPPTATVSIGGLGDAQFPANLLGISVAHGVRVGLEDALYMDPERTHRATNPLMVRRILSVAQKAGRPVMKPAAFRASLGMREGGVHGYGR
jgi:uncharacterized protein (DUF849 family)